MTPGLFNKFLGEFPSQQALAAVVILLWIATGAVMLTGRAPAEGWIGALDTVTFAAVLKYGVKRWSYDPKGKSEVITEKGEDPNVPEAAVRPAGWDSVRIGDSVTGAQRDD